MSARWQPAQFVQLVGSDVLQFDRALGADEQLDAERFLERADRLRKRRLRHRQTRRRAPEVLLFGDGDEIAQLAQVGGSGQHQLILFSTLYNLNNILDTRLKTLHSCATC